MLIYSATVSWLRQITYHLLKYTTELPIIQLLEDWDLLLPKLGPCQWIGFLDLTEPILQLK